MDALSKKGTIKVLDVGCGTGIFWKKNLSKLNQFNLDTTFTDYTEAMVEKEKINTVDVKGKKAYEIADIENLQKYYGKFEKINVLIDDIRLFYGNFQNYPDKNILVDWCKENNFSWEIEHDIFICKKK